MNYIPCACLFYPGWKLSPLHLQLCSWLPCQLSCGSHCCYPVILALLAPSQPGLCKQGNSHPKFRKEYQNEPWPFQSTKFSFTNLCIDPSYFQSFILNREILTSSCKIRGIIAEVFWSVQSYISWLKQPLKPVEISLDVVTS